MKVSLLKFVIKKTFGGSHYEKLQLNIPIRKHYCYGHHLGNAGSLTMDIVVSENLLGLLLETMCSNNS